MDNWQKAMELEHYIRNYTPKGFREPISKFDYAPYISDDNYTLFETAYKDDTLSELLTTYSDSHYKGVNIYRFNKPYIIRAIQDYFKQGE